MAGSRRPTRRDIDHRRVAESLKGPGIDTRFWCSHATVGTMDDQGKFDPTDKRSIIVAPDGVWVDVRLEPSGIPVTARVQLGVGGQAHILAPINPGDEVLVHIPSGNPSNPPTVAAILNNQRFKIPIGKDKKPIFKNDRVLIHVKDKLPIELNAVKIQLGDETAAEPLVLGNQWKELTEKILQQLAIHVHPTAVGPSGPSVEMQQLNTEEKPKLPDRLSDVAFTLKKQT